MKLLVTGGAGFIGSHTVIELLESGHEVVVVDNLCNSTADSLKNVEKITRNKFEFVQVDIRDTDKLVQLCRASNFDAVIHFAALKAVGESVKHPLSYYDNNISGTCSLLRAMSEANINKLLFSSSATVYGDPDSCPISEDFPLKAPTNPYGATKQMCEQIIADVCAATDLRAINLRYFNPIGAHPSGLIGELPKGAPNNLVPYVAQVAAGVRDTLTVFGDDYDTPDGSGIRDYIHVVDLAKAHVAAAEHLLTMDEDCLALNIGTGNGVSVLDIITTFEKVNSVKVPYVIGPRRDGDISICYADPTKAGNILGWHAEETLETALEDAWRWQQNIEN
ncbi:UDP-glucose 4-epimerase GalE [Candidatus Saccharibacteria bacterium]|nr:UDP-glucose 4-epimerase GalE [Candidatus Saccharibacteria bacterium]